MIPLHAVVRIDHKTATIVHFDAEHVQTQTIKAQVHYTRQHGSTVRSEHEFYSGVADALAGVSEVLVVGPGQAHAEFKRYCDKHRPDVGRHIIGTEVVDHPTDPQLVAMARKYFLRHDQMTGTAPLPT
jgi:stalled ribosome rescue protein Dom34